jgi:limonene-1,2-epoxide hydrolase
MDVALKELHDGVSAIPHSQVHIVGVFELDSEGKIVSERDYFDMKEIEAQIGGA